jgi:hypothetical protein
MSNSQIPRAAKPASTDGVLEPGSREERAYLGHRNVDTLINEALAIINPPAVQKVSCHTSVVHSIRRVIDAARLIPSKELPLKEQKKQRDKLKKQRKEQRGKLANAAQSLRKLRREIEKNESYLLLPLQISPIPVPVPPNAFEKRRQEDEKREKDLKRRRLLLESFLKELDRSVARFDQLSKDAEPKRSGGKKDYQKRDAALNAFILLREFSGKRPTLTVDAAFHELAGTLYKAATGKTADLYPQCRAMFEFIRGSGSKPS